MTRRIDCRSVLKTNDVFEDAVAVRRSFRSENPAVDDDDARLMLDSSQEERKMMRQPGGSGNQELEDLRSEENGIEVPVEDLLMTT